MPDSQPTSVLQAETVSNRLALPPPRENSPRNSVLANPNAATAVLKRVLRPQSIWRSGLQKAVKAWRRVVRTQQRNLKAYRASVQNVNDFLAANDQQQEATCQDGLRLSEVQAAHVPQFLQHDHRRSTVPEIFLNSPSKRRLTVHEVPPSPRPARRANQTRSLRFSHPATTAAYSRMFASTSSSPHASVRETIHSTTATIISSGSSSGVQIPPFLREALAEARPRPRSLHQVDGVVAGRDYSCKSKVVTSKRWFRGPWKYPLPAIAKLPEPYLGDLPTILELINGEDRPEVYQQRLEAFNALVGVEDSTDVKRVLSDREFIEEWAQDADLTQSMFMSMHSQWPGKPRPFSQYRPFSGNAEASTNTERSEHSESLLPARQSNRHVTIIASTPETVPTPLMTPTQPETSLPETPSAPIPVPSGEVIVTPSGSPLRPSSPNVDAQDKGKAAADPEVQRNLDAARAESSTQTQPERHPTVLRPAAVRASRLEHPLPELPGDNPSTSTSANPHRLSKGQAAALAHTISTKRKPVPTRSGPAMPSDPAPAQPNYRNANTQTKVPVIRKRDVMEKVLLKTFVFEYGPK